MSRQIQPHDVVAGIQQAGESEITQDEPIEGQMGNH
jgi:hypothetical protein